MKYENALSLAAQEFSKAQIPFVLIGGFAVNYHKVTRATNDVDFLINRNDYRKALVLLQPFGYREALVQDMFARLKSEESDFLVDLIFVDSQTLEGIITEGKKVKMFGNDVVVPSVQHLIALKLHAMKNNPKRIEHPDFMDIVHLIDANQLNVKTDEFKDLCLTYGTNELYGKLINHFFGK